jgi:hypothetical protein
VPAQPVLYLCLPTKLEDNLAKRWIRFQNHLQTYWPGGRQTVLSFAPQILIRSTHHPRGSTGTSHCSSLCYTKVQSIVKVPVFCIYGKHSDNYNINRKFHILEKLIDDQLDISGQNGVQLKHYTTARLEALDLSSSLATVTCSIHAYAISIKESLAYVPLFLPLNSDINRKKKKKSRRRGKKLLYRLLSQRFLFRALYLA